ncbi:substrate-binding domain-containing protein [Pseudonocardia sp.]|jgi:ribose transport system substrate-binding protein|uniref:substrate-binding domain-containing protein n=1 Tax=Pseudonocardia sp. TaxID=60912 RepID=UPI002603D0FB|nr:substrate-binding domain-containing protein [Pseudonocardia sp.]MCW2721710.1 monosaccharide transporter substrate-binding protein family [Pseudonocardia sp.]MDT7616606.1 ribose transport system substrate-binding protein [Pseudonocardiales bacterium]
MKSPVRTIAAAACLTFALAACSTGTGTSSSADPATSAKADAALATLSSSVLSKGPHGETAANADSITLTPAELAQVKAKNATAAIVLHYGGNDWSQAQVEGLKSEFAQLGITVQAVTDANFKPDKQVSDLETVMSRKPNVIVSIPTDPVATAAEYKKVADAGTKLVFMDNVPQGLVAGKDYTSVVSADNYANGVASAHLMAKSLGGKGKIGVIFHQADFFVTKQRYDGFTSTLKSDYPGIQIVDAKGIAGPDFAGDAQAAANALLTKNPDLNGIWAVWDVPAEGVMAAARSAGRQDLVIATEDLGKNVAIALAKNELVKGLGAQRPFDQGVTEAKLAAYALLGKQAPAYVALQALPVTHDNVLQAWTQVYHQPVPADLQQSFVK